LHRPSFAQSDIAIGAGTWRGNRCGREERYDKTYGSQRASEFPSDPGYRSRKDIFLLAVRNHHELPSQRQAMSAI
jgi:hypothetical protein